MGEAKSPRPWRFEKWEGNGCYAIKDASGVAVMFAGPDTDLAMDIDDAQRSLEAVNSHDQLVEALKGVAIMLNTELAKYDAEPWAQRVRAALQSAEQTK